MMPPHDPLAVEEEIAEASKIWGRWAGRGRREEAFWPMLAGDGSPATAPGEEQGSLPTGLAAADERAEAAKIRGSRAAAVPAC